MRSTILAVGAATLIWASSGVQAQSNWKDILWEVNRGAFWVLESDRKSRNILDIRTIKETCENPFSDEKDLPDWIVPVKESLEFIDWIFSWKEPCRFDRIEIVVRLINSLLYEQNESADRVLIDSNTRQQLRERLKKLQPIRDLMRSYSIWEFIEKLKKIGKVELMWKTIWKFIDTWELDYLLFSDLIIESIATGSFWKTWFYWGGFVWKINHISSLFEDLQSLRWLWWEHQKRLEQRFTIFNNFYDKNKRSLELLFEKKWLDKVSVLDLQSLVWYRELCNEMNKALNPREVAFIYRQMKDPIRKYIVQIILSILK